MAERTFHPKKRKDTEKLFMLSVHLPFVFTVGQPCDLIPSE